MLKTHHILWKPTISFEINIQILSQIKVTSNDETYRILNEVLINTFHHISIKSIHKFSARAQTNAKMFTSYQLPTYAPRCWYSQTHLKQSPMAWTKTDQLKQVTDTSFSGAFDLKGIWKYGCLKDVTINTSLTVSIFLSTVSFFTFNAMFISIEKHLQLSQFKRYTNSPHYYYCKKAHSHTNEDILYKYAWIQTLPLSHDGK